MDARKNTLGPSDALALLKDVNEVYAMKGKQVVHFNLKKEMPAEETLKSVLLGPTGNLRAPTVRKGKTLIVGFDEEIYRKVFG